MDRNSGVLVRVGASLRRHVVLIRGAFSGCDVAALENDGCVSEDEVDGSGDEAFDEELTVRVDVESVLVG